MKNISLALNVVLIIAVGVLYYLHFSDDRRNSEVSDKSADSVSVPQKIDLPEIRSINGPIAYINADDLDQNYQYIKDVNAQLDAYKNQKKNYLQTQANKLREDYQKFAESAQALTPEIIAAREQDFKKREYDLMMEQEKFQDEIVEKQENNYKILFQKVDDHLRELSKEKNYSYVFTYSKGGPASIVFANDSLDITQQVVNGLNAEYKQQKNKK